MLFITVAVQDFNGCWNTIRGSCVLGTYCKCVMGHILISVPAQSYVLKYIKVSYLTHAFLIWPDCLFFGFMAALLVPFHLRSIQYTVCWSLVLVIFSSEHISYRLPKYKMQKCGCGWVWMSWMMSELKPKSLKSLVGKLSPAAKWVTDVTR